MWWAKKVGISNSLKRHLLAICFLISFLIVLSEKLLQSLMDFCVSQASSAAQLQTISLAGFSTAYYHSFCADSNYLYSEANFISKLWCHFAIVLVMIRITLIRVDSYWTPYYRLGSKCFICVISFILTRTLISISPMRNWNHVEIKLPKVTLYGGARI